MAAKQTNSLLTVNHFPMPSFRKPDKHSPRTATAFPPDGKGWKKQVAVSHETTTHLI